MDSVQSPSSQNSQSNNPSKSVIDEYAAGFGGAHRERLNELLALIRETIPEAEEKISYQIPTFKGDKNIVHFAAFKNHIGFYPGPAAIEKYAEELPGYKTSKGAIHLSLDKKIPKTLIRKIVKFAEAKANSRLRP